MCSSARREIAQGEKHWQVKKFESNYARMIIT